jgi:hypothetical protein
VNSGVVRTVVIKWGGGGCGVAMADLVLGFGKGVLYVVEQVLLTFPYFFGSLLIKNKMCSSFLMLSAACMHAFLAISIYQLIKSFPCFCTSFKGGIYAMKTILPLFFHFSKNHIN